MYEEVSLADLAQIFRHSVVRWKNLPVYVTNITGERKLEICELDAPKNIQEIDPSDADLDVSPVPLGMCNEGSDAFYLSRAPKRQYKQGLNSDVLMVKNIGDYTNKNLERVQSLRSVGIKNCINGVYPSIQEAVELLEAEKASSVAFSRQFALDDDFNVIFKWSKVGMYSPEKKDFVFSRKNSYLKELINASR